MLIELEPGLFLCLCCCYIGSNCDTKSGCPVCCVWIDCNLLSWTCMLLKFLVSLILPLGSCPCVATGGIQISQQYVKYGQHMIFSSLMISTNKLYIILLKLIKPRYTMISNPDKSLSTHMQDFLYTTYLHWKFQSLALHGKVNRHIR